MSRFNRPRPHSRPMTGFNELLPDSALDALTGGLEPTDPAELEARKGKLCACGAPVCQQNLCARCWDNREIV